MDEFDEGAMAAAQRTAEAASDSEYATREQMLELRAQVDAYALVLQELLVQRVRGTSNPVAAIELFATQLGDRLAALDAEGGEEHAHISKFLRAARERVE